MVWTRPATRSLVVGFLALGLAAVTAAQDTKSEKKDEPRKGTVTGIVVAKGDDWVEIKADGDEKARRYSPYWRGGAPAAKIMVAAIKDTPLNSRVRIEWIFSERLRVEKLEILKKPDDKEK